jgi:hypothetical protein
MLGPPPPLGRRDRAARCALRAPIAHRHQPLTRHVGADPSARAIDPLLDLLRKRIQPRPRPHRHRQTADDLIAGAHPVRDRLVITPDKLRCTTQRARQIKRLQDLHHFLRAPQARLLDAPPMTRRPEQPTGQDDTTGRSDGHPWGDPMAANGDFRSPPMGRFPWPPSVEVDQLHAVGRQVGNNSHAVARCPVVAFSHKQGESSERIRGDAGEVQASVSVSEVSQPSRAGSC